MNSNIAELCGKVVSEPVFSHKTYGEAFYTFLLGIERKSAYIDEVTVMVSDRLIFDKNLETGRYIEVKGQVRTYNEYVDGRNKLIIVVFARELSCDIEYPYNENYIYLEGYLCKPSVRRTSPLGRDICDMMLAVNRMYNKSDYIPCIAWGRNAVYAESIPVGTKLYIEGRLQSREYRKHLENGEYEMRRAYEVSIIKLEEE